MRDGGDDDKHGTFEGTRIGKENLYTQLSIINPDDLDWD
jgi:hypothetical protein